MSGKNKPYPAVTIAQDRMGCLHLFKGTRKIRKTGPYMWRDARNREADVFIQNSQDVVIILNNLSPKARKSVENGYDIVTNFISDEYFD